MNKDWYLMFCNIFMNIITFKDPLKAVNKLAFLPTVESNLQAGTAEATSMASAHPPLIFHFLSEYGVNKL